MLFNSPEFLIFFPLVVVLFFLAPSRFQWVVLLLASAYFYMSFVPWYILILIFLVIIDYSLGRAMEHQVGVRRKLLLIVSIVGNLGILFVFKYFNFFNANITALAHAIGWNYSIESLRFLLPIGLSFHVFQSLAYVIEVYRGKYPAEKHLGMYALYVLFFPQLVAGPIERPANLLPQLHLGHTFNYERMMNGLTLMLWGFFKKLVIADQLALVVDQVYGNLYGVNSTAIVIAVILFSYQLYCDFSGYSDIAIGAARVLGFELSINFNRPYAARSIAEFWRRWHISLSNWLRDYLFFPLAVKWREWGKGGSYAATIVTFVLIGLWHGANWTFVGLGAVHGIYLVIGLVSKSWREKFAAQIGLTGYPWVRAFLQIFLTFILVSLSWVFFRAQHLRDVWYVMGNIIPGVTGFFDFGFMRDHVFTREVLGTSFSFFALRIIAIAFMEVVEFFTRNAPSLRSAILCWPFSARVTVYYVVLLWIFLLGYFDTKSFIYFQF